MEKEIFEDDGSLACLHLPADRANKRFVCKEERQENLINKTFWLQDFFPDVQTRFGMRHLYKATYEKDDPDGKAFKVFTGAAACKFKDVRRRASWTRSSTAPTACPSATTSARRSPTSSWRTSTTTSRRCSA